MNKNMKFSLKITSSNFYYLENGFEIDYKYNKQVSDNEKNRIGNNLDELLTKYEGTLFKNREDLQRLISGGYINDEIGKRPLSKLIKDIHRRKQNEKITDKNTNF